MSYTTELEEEKRHFDRAMRCFKQHPTPSMLSVLERIESRIKYLRRCIKKEASK